VCSDPPSSLLLPPFSDALESKTKALAGKLSAEQQAAAMKQVPPLSLSLLSILRCSVPRRHIHTRTQEADVMQQTTARLEERLHLETDKAAAATKRVETLEVSSLAMCMCFCAWVARRASTRRIRSTLLQVE